MLREILDEINLLKQELKKIQIQIKNLENDLEEAPSLVDLEGQLDLIADDRLLELYDLEDDLYYRIKQLYNIIFQKSYLDADIMGDAIAKLLTKEVGVEYVHITPMHQSRAKETRPIRIVVPKDKRRITFMGAYCLPKDTIVLDSNINGSNLDKKINFISSFKHENIDSEINESLYLNINTPINGKFRDNYLSVPMLPLIHYQIIEGFVSSIIEYKLEKNKELLSVDDVDMILNKQILPKKSLTISKR